VRKHIVDNHIQYAEVRNNKNYLKEKKHCTRALLEFNIQTDQFSISSPEVTAIYCVYCTGSYISDIEINQVFIPIRRQVQLQICFGVCDELLDSLRNTAPLTKSTSITKLQLARFSAFPKILNSPAKVVDMIG